MNPLIRWAGSKRALIPILRQYWPSGSRYIEPFCGSGCLFFSIEPTSGILGDINAELITAYRTLQREPETVADMLAKLRVSKETYYAFREQNPFKLSDRDLTVRFLYLNRLCFNGIYRTNLSGNFNVPYGPPKKTKKKSPVIFNSAALLATAKLLARANFVNGDFEYTLSHARKGDFVYLDPPYAVSNRRIFSEYHPDSFSISDIERLKSALKTLDSRGVSFVVSYADSREGRTLAAGWNTRRIRTRRNVAGFAGHRKSAYELVASNLEPKEWQ